MCIIATKAKGINNINWKYLENCFKHNNDGAGYMYACQKLPYVQIKKGFMKWGDFEKALKADIKKYGLKNLDLVLHFRIGTHGTNSPENTHPFKISNKIKDLRLLNTTTDLGVCMNGILYDVDMDKNATHSDTMEYIKTALYSFKSISNEFLTNQMINYIDKTTGVKWAFLSAKNGITKIGTFNDCDGWSYSNYSYLERDYYSLKNYNYCDYIYNDDYMIAGDEVELYDGYIVTDNGEYIDIMDNIIILDKDNNIYLEDYGTGERLEVFGKAYLSDGERATYKRLCNGV